MEAAPPPALRRTRSLGALGVATVAFAAVAGGPFGLEPAIGLGGGLPTLLMLLVAGACWAAPQALMVAELSSRLPSNAGYIGWVLRGLGPTPGFINAWVCNLQQALNLPLYAVLACSSLEQLIGGLPAAAEAGVKLAVVAVAVGVNLAGVGAVERVAGVLVLLVQTPFLAMPLVWAAAARPFAWGALGQSVAGWQGSLAGFLSTILWNMQGWNVLGNVAGEVLQPARNIPLGIALGLIAVLLNYVWPLLLTVPMSPPPSPPDDPSLPGARWGAGFFAGLAAQASPGLGIWAAACSVLSCTANFIPQLATASRALQATAHLRMVPGPAALGQWLAGGGGSSSGTPRAALAVMAAASAGLMALSFETLVTTQILLALVGLCLQFGAFLRLRHAAAWEGGKALGGEPPGPAEGFTVPGGLVGAWACALPFFLLAAVIAYSNVAGAAESNLIGIGSVVGVTVVLGVVGEVWWVRGGGYSAALVDQVLLGGEECEGAEGGGGGEEATSALLARA